MPGYKLVKSTDKFMEVFEIQDLLNLGLDVLQIHFDLLQTSRKDHGTHSRALYAMDISA